MNFPIPPNESARLAALHDLEILDTAPDREFDELVRLACELFDVPIGAISLIDRDRQWFKAVEGLARETSRETAFCAHTICSSEPLIVRDATIDQRFARSELVTGVANIRFYAGVPLEIAPSVNLGSFCILDTKPRTLTPPELSRLTQLGNLTVALLRNQQRLVQIRSQARIIDDQEQQLRRKHRLLERACELGKLGAWERDMATGELEWTDGMYRIHDVVPGTKRNVAEHVELYPEPERSRLTALMREADRTRQPYRFEGRTFNSKGDLKWIRLVSEVEFEGGHLVRRYGLMQDITEEKLLLDRVRHLANSDELTGLANRRVLQRKLADFRKSKERPETIALMALDLDGFKGINDTHGHAAGDACLRRVATRLKRAVQGDVLLARVGGDEFLLLWTGTDANALGGVIDSVSRAIRKPVVWRGNSLEVSCSIGVAIRTGRESLVPDDMMHEADLALYDAKRDGKNCWRVFSRELEAADLKRKSALKSARAGLSENRFRLFFQPKVLLADGSTSGFEALLRLVSDDGSVVAPRAFWAALEDRSLSRELGDFVVDTALRQAQAWSRAGLAFGHIAINLAPSQLRNPSFSRHFLNQLAAFGLPTRAVAVEVTEGVLLSSQGDVITSNCQALKEAGVSIAFDDFGTGFASLTHLRDFPVDTIKVDRSFVRGLDRGGNSTAIVNAIVGLGNNLGLNVVAEGVESQAQREFLAAIGCRFAQGYLFGRPVPAEEAEALLRSCREADDREVYEIRRRRA